ncbi:MAG: hypothetical protein ACRD98_00385 [Nitrososphaera sp.]
MKKSAVGLLILAVLSQTAGAQTYPTDTLYDGTKAVPVLAQPAYKQSVIDPVFGTRITRISDVSMGPADAGLLNPYSKIQAWNSDSTKIMLGSGRYVLDAITYNVLLTQGFHMQARWSTVSPNDMFYILNNQFLRLNVQTGVDTVLRTFTQGNINMGNGEGNLSIGDKYVVFNVIGGFTTVILYDLETDTIAGIRNVAADTVNTVDFVSISPSGLYVIAWHGPSGNGRNLVYDRANFANASIAPRVIPDVHVGHEDNGYDTAGVESKISVCPMLRTRINTGVDLPLLPAPYNTSCGHISTRNYNRPGWALKSGNGELYAIKLDGSGIVERFAHERSSNRNYDAIPKGSASPDGSKVIWSSDWENTLAPIYAYVAEMPVNPCQGVLLDVSTAVSDGGFAYKIVKSFGTPPDNTNFLTQSTLRLFEQSLELGPAHSVHADIRNLGQGRFSHWSSTTGTGEALRFAASDNTDPRTNGRSYTYCVPVTVPGAVSNWQLIPIP